MVAELQQLMQRMKALAGSGQDLSSMQNLLAQHMQPSDFNVLRNVMEHTISAKERQGPPPVPRSVQSKWHGAELAEYEQSCQEEASGKFSGSMLSTMAAPLQGLQPLQLAQVARQVNKIHVGNSHHHAACLPEGGHHRVCGGQCRGQDRAVSVLCARGAGPATAAACGELPRGSGALHAAHS